MVKFTYKNLLLYKIENPAVLKKMEIIPTLLEETRRDFKTPFNFDISFYISRMGTKVGDELMSMSDKDFLEILNLRYPKKNGIPYTDASLQFRMSIIGPRDN